MSSLRNILQRCARKASILGSTPLQIQCTFNPVYSAYPTSISRQAYSSDANEAPENGIDPVQKYLLKMMNAKKSRSKILQDQKASRSFAADSAQKIPFGQTVSVKSPPSVIKDHNASKAPIFNTNLNLRKYYITIHGLSNETTPESLREFYSQFGEIAYCNIIFPGERRQFGSVAFISRTVKMDRALNALPHCIDGKEIKNVHPGILGRRQLTLCVRDLFLNTTTKTLKKFYSRFGSLNGCVIKKAISGNFGEVTFLNPHDMHRALDAQPHVIDGSEVFLQYATNDLEFLIADVPNGITEDELIAFYSKYGQLRECRLQKGKTGKSHAHVSFYAVNEFNRAMDDRPHIIGGKPLKIKFCDKDHLTPVSLFVGSLPENVTEETLREEFSKYGKPVFWKVENEGLFNESGPYGFVTYSTEKEALNALKSGPHTIEGAVVDVKKAIKPAKMWQKE
ncbi:RNA recognition motif domain-containing protein [Ditylenchus destructor]|nr:RNA recognition motif domain-containing protein [Ditylenchus destructor]